MSIAADDAKLAALKLPANETLLENKELDAAEEKTLAERIVAKIPGDQADKLMAQFDPISRLRIYRGMITNNKGTEAERLQEAAETYARIGEWRAKHADTVLTTSYKGEDVLNAAMCPLVGGFDLYGHLVWGEKLGDVKSVVEYPLTTDEAKEVRLKMMETIRLLQTKAVKERGAIRYKQVYVIDLAEVSLGTLMTRSDVRAMTKAIMGVATEFFPETMWKCFIINAPFVFRSVYAMVSPFIHPVTKEKIKILAGPSKYLPEMANAGLAKDQLPKGLGGDMPDRPLKDLMAAFAVNGGSNGAVVDGEPAKPAADAAA